MAVGILTCFYGYTVVFVAPKDFPVGKSFVINEDESLKSISGRLKEENIVTSALLFRAGVSFFEKDRYMQVGRYLFSTPTNLLGSISFFGNGHPTSPLLSVTIPEGSTSFEVATLVIKVMPTISSNIFSETISNYNAEGKLFPSTYFLLPSYTAEEIVKLMLATFAKKVTPAIHEHILPPLTTEHDVLVLASIVQGEAKSEEDMKMVAGILLSRLTKGMPLQVDVAKETYKKKGLPVMPINNPGLTAIGAVLYPTVTSYLFYITGDDGKMYYAKTFEEHKRNVRKYLR